MKRSGFKKKIYKPLKRTPLKAKKGFKPGKGWKRGNVSIPGNILVKTQKRAKFGAPRALSPMLEADRLHSLVVRRKDALSGGFVECVTCGTMRHWSEMHCGHYRPRQHLATRYLFENTAVQCPDCNCFEDQEIILDKFASYLRYQYGRKIIVELFRKSAETVHGFDFQAIIDERKKQLADLVEIQDNVINY